MGRKKKKPQKPWCWYCNREFEDEKILIQHQKAKHFKCHICHKKLYTGPGLAIHCMQVHKETLDKVPNAIVGRTNIDIEIYGMEGIPPEDIKLHEQQKRERGDQGDGGGDSDDEAPTTAPGLLGTPGGPSGPFPGGFAPGTRLPTSLPPGIRPQAAPVLPPFQIPGMPPIHINNLQRPPQMHGMPPPGMYPPPSMHPPPMYGMPPPGQQAPAQSHPPPGMNPQPWGAPPRMNILPSNLGGPPSGPPPGSGLLGMAPPNQMPVANTNQPPPRPLFPGAIPERPPVQLGNVDLKSGPTTGGVPTFSNLQGRPGLAPTQQVPVMVAPPEQGGHICHPSEDISLEELRAKRFPKSWEGKKTMKTSGHLVYNFLESGIETDCQNVVLLLFQTLCLVSSQ